MGMQLLEAFDLLVSGEQITQRLAVLGGDLAAKPELEEESRWLAAAQARLAPIFAGARIGDLLNRSLGLPELESIKGERGKFLQSAAVDAVLDLHQAITTAATSRSPVLETVYRNLKPITMRRTPRDVFEAFCCDIERRLSSSYVQRMLSNEEYEPAAPAVLRLHAAFADWRCAYAAMPLGEEEVSALRTELLAAASAASLPLRQAQHLARAALLPEEALLAASGLLEKSKRRSLAPAKAEGQAPQPE